MNQTPDPFDTNRPPNRFDPQNLSQELNSRKVELPTDLHPDTKKVLQKVFITLIVVGAIVGVVVSVGVLKVMQHYGLTNAPPREQKAN